MNCWKCTTCNLSVHINNKNDHVNGKRHRTLLLSPAPTSWTCSVCGLAMSVADKDSHIATHAATAQPTTSNLWTCNVCSSTMSIKDKVSHRAGTKHRSAAQAPTPPSLWTCGVCSLAMSVTDKDSHFATHAVTAQATSSTSNPWTCGVCSLTMAVNNKDSHLAGAKHRSAVQAADPSARLRLPPGWWECATCDRAPMKAHNKNAHLKSKGHRASVLAGAVKSKRWQVCTVCDKAVLQDEMDEHNANQASGAGRRWEKSRRGGGGSSDGDGGSSDDGSNDYDDDEEYDSEEEDGLSILRDIDTQWGMIPGGGAYKESNFYYGPGIYDYY